MPTAKEIRQRVEAKGLTIPAICRRADIVTATFYRWENGLGTPTLATVQRLLDALEREGA